MKKNILLTNIEDMIAEEKSKKEIEYWIGAINYDFLKFQKFPYHV